MPRERLRLGEWGKITTLKSGGRTVARTRIRDTDGKKRTVEASGRSATEARSRLQKKLSERTVPSGEIIQELTKSSTMSHLYAYWIDQKAKVVAPQTITGYKQAWSSYCASPVGELLIREITTGKIDSLISSISERTPSGARISRVILSGMLGTAVRFDFLEHNPVREVPRPTIKRQAIRALTRDELDELRGRKTASHSSTDPRRARRASRADPKLLSPPDCRPARSDLTKTRPEARSAPRGHFDVASRHRWQNQRSSCLDVASNRSDLSNSARHD